MNNKYVGNRYVPIVAGTWDNTKNTAYDSLTIVLWGGNSYTAVKAVPKGIDISNTNYWVCTGNYDAQVELYRQDVNNFKDTFNAELDFIEQLKLKFVFGAKGDGVTDDTIALTNYINYAIANLPYHIYIPKGTYLYTTLPNLAYNGLTIEGAGDKETILKCTSTVVNHNAVLFDAFTGGTPQDQFVFRCNLKNIQIQGNTNTDTIINAQGLAGCNWENVIANSANSVSGKAYNFRGVMTSNFKNVTTSTNYGNDIPIPYYGLYVTEGLRGGVSCGSSTNNVFKNCYFEAVAIGIHLVKADQNTFIGGSAEACTDTGVIIDNGCRWNSFIGGGYERNTNFDIVDYGRSTQFINIYASNHVQLRGQQSKIDGGYFGCIEVIGSNNVIENCRVNMEGTDQGGFIDNGLQTYWKNLYNLDVAVNNYIFPLKNRIPITPTGSPQTWNNDTGHYVEIICQTGVLTEVTGNRNGASSWLLPVNVPGSWIVAPNDSITFTYSSDPGLSYLVFNGF